MFEFSLFILLAIVLVITSILVITRVNPISSALYLVFAFLALASLYGMLSASFVAAIQILVYTGGILVLIIFVIMIMNLTMEDLLPLRADYLLIVSLALIIIGGSLLPALFIVSNYLNFDTIKISENFDSIKEIANVLYSKYVFAFEMLSLLLLTAIIGALVIAKRKI